MRTSSSASPPRDRLRVLGWGLIQILAGAAAAGAIVLLPVFRVDVCDEGWRAAPAGLLATSAVLVVLAARFAATRLLLGSCALVLAVYAAWLLYFAGALGCE